MDSSNIKKTFYTSVWIIIFSSFAATAGMVVDGVFIGRFLGDNAMAAFGIVSPIFLLGTAIGGLISSGVSAVCSKKVGENDRKGAQSVFILSLFIVGILSILFILILILFSKPIVSLLGADTEELSLPAMEYIYGLLLWFPSSLIFMMMQPVMQLDDDKIRILFATMVTTIVDILLDILFIKVFHGGMMEMALATSISYVIGVFVYVFHFYKKNTFFRICMVPLEFSGAMQIFAYGFPTALQRFSGTLRTFALNKVLLGVSGAMAITALTVQSNMYNIFASVGLGISMTTLTFTGVLIGENNQEKIRELMNLSLKAAVLMNSTVMVILFVGAPFFVKLYLGSNLASFECCLTAVRLFSLSLPFHAISNVYVSYFQAVGKLRRSNILTFLNDFLYTFIFAVLLGFIWGENGVFASFVAGRCCTMITLYLMFAKEKKHLPKTIDDII